MREYKQAKYSYNNTCQHDGRVISGVRKMYMEQLGNIELYPRREPSRIIRVDPVLFHESHLICASIRWNTYKIPLDFEYDTIKQTMDMYYNVADADKTINLNAYQLYEIMRLVNYIGVPLVIPNLKQRVGQQIAREFGECVGRPIDGEILKHLLSVDDNFPQAREIIEYYVRKAIMPLAEFASKKGRICNELVLSRYITKRQAKTPAFVLFGDADTQKILVDKYLKNKCVCSLKNPENIDFVLGIIDVCRALNGCTRKEIPHYALELYRKYGVGSAIYVGGAWAAMRQVPKFATKTAYKNYRTAVCVTRFHTPGGIIPLLAPTPEQSWTCIRVGNNKEFARMRKFVKRNLDKKAA